MDLDEYARGVALDEIKRLRFLRRCVIGMTLVSLVLVVSTIVRDAIGNGDGGDIALYVAGVFLFSCTAICGPRTSVKKYIQHLKDIGGIKENQDVQK